MSKVDAVTRMGSVHNARYVVEDEAPRAGRWRRQVCSGTLLCDEQTLRLS
jgi:hypothetical protein